MSGAGIADSERALALNFAAREARPALSALWRLDEALGRIVTSTTEPMIGQMRLTWWYDRLTALGREAALAEPLLRDLEAHVLPHDVTGAQLAVMVEGWEALLDPLPLHQSALKCFARLRGAGLFWAAANILKSSTDPLNGEGWALIDFASRCSDATTAYLARNLARACFGLAQREKLKPLRIIARLAASRARNEADEIAAPLSRFSFLRAVLG